MIDLEKRELESNDVKKEQYLMLSAKDVENRQSFKFPKAIRKREKEIDPITLKFI